MDTPQQYSAAETERMMKLQDVLLKAMAKKIRWWDAAEIIGVTDRTMRRWAIASFGAEAKEKLANPAVTGQPEDQLRSPFERLLYDLAELAKIPRAVVAAVGESSVGHLKTRPDYAITVRNALVGFVELKAPGKGADPRKFKDAHDREQWGKLRSLPNLLYTDGNAFSLWQSGEVIVSVISLIGDIEISGNKMEAPQGLSGLF